MATLLAACALVGWQGGGPSAARGQAPPAASPDGSRIVTVRVYQGGHWVAKGETPESIGAALASLEPTHVEALIRFRAGERISQPEIDAWNTITQAVLATSPDAQFAIELNALEYKNAGDLNAMMSRVRTAFDNDGWLFDFYTPAARKKPKLMAAAVANAHANGEWLGGNAFGIKKNPPIPAGTDFIAVQDFHFRINLNAVRRLATRVPAVYFHLGNSPGFPGSDGCLFIKELSTKKRLNYVTKRAEQQAGYSFRFSYPVFFPECAKTHANRPVIYTYNAPNDDPMMDTIGTLLDQYDD